MKVLTILGTRPEIIRLSRVIPRLDEILGRENHIVADTQQNHSNVLSGRHMNELGLRLPDCYCPRDGGSSVFTFVGRLLPWIESVLVESKPDRVLILGDTNSSLAAIVAARMRIPVYHMEAGNRCYDPRSPEEVNRRLIDHASSILMPYTERSRQNLLAEGIEGQRIFVTGNPIFEVIRYYREQINQSDVLERLGLESRRYFLVTLHREENVDDYGRLGNLIRAFNHIQCQYEMPVIVSAHPRLRDRISCLNKTSPPEFLSNPSVRFLDPFGFFDFIALERNAVCVLTDSGTVQEECAIQHVPVVVLRDYTERPETIECGATVLSGAGPERIIELAAVAMKGKRPGWAAPDDYLRTNVADTVVRIVTSHYQGGRT